MSQVLLPGRDVRQETDTWEDTWIKGIMDYAVIGVEKTKRVVGDITKNIGIPLDAPPEAQATESVKSD